MKMIRITTDNEISVHEFPEGNFAEENVVIREHIGPRCELYEGVRPKRLYNELGAATSRNGGVSMLVDEDGLYHELDMNTVRSWLYETDRHGHPIVGNILIVGTEWRGSGVSYCGISEEQFDLLYPQLEMITRKARNLS